ncbi:MAG: hypothetical protein ACYC6C_10725 [Coriobacteriia bacterium]
MFAGTIGANEAIPQIPFDDDVTVNVENTAPTNVTNLGGSTPGGTVKLIFANANTTVVHGAATIRLSGATNWTPAAGDSLTLTHDEDACCWR